MVSFSITRTIICGRSLFSNSTRIEGFWDEDDIPQPHQNGSNRTRIKVLVVKAGGREDGQTGVRVGRQTGSMRIGRVFDAYWVRIGRT